MSDDIYGVVGLGRFGLAVAKTLLEGGRRIIALDRDPERVKELAKYTDDVFVIPQITKEALIEAGIDHCSTVIVGIGRSIESSLLVALNAIELKVYRVIAKANSDEHARILQMIGAEVVFPEVDMGTRLAKSLRNHMSIDFLSLADDFSIVQTNVPEKFVGKSVVDADLRKRYGVNIIAKISAGHVESDIKPTTVLGYGDILVISGKDKNISAFMDV